MKLLDNVFFWRRNQIENDVFFVDFRQFFKCLVDLNSQVRVLDAIVCFKLVFKSFPFKISQIVGIFVVFQSCNESSEHEPYRLMAKDWNVILGHKAVQKDVENNLNISELNGKFFYGVIAEGFDQKVRDGVDELINKNVFHGFVQNWPVLKKFLILSVMFVKDVPQNRVTDIKLFNGRTGQNMNLETMDFEGVWDLAYIIVVDQLTELDETEKVLVGLLLNHCVIKFWDERKCGDGWEGMGKVFFGGEYALDDEEDFRGILCGNDLRVGEDRCQGLYENINVLDRKCLILNQIVNKVEIHEKILGIMLIEFLVEPVIKHVGNMFEEDNIAPFIDKGYQALSWIEESLIEELELVVLEEVHPDSGEVVFFVLAYDLFVEALLEGFHWW